MVLSLLLSDSCCGELTCRHLGTGPQESADLAVHIREVTGNLVALVRGHGQQQVVCWRPLELDHLAGDLREQGVAGFEVNHCFLLIQPLAGQEERSLSFNDMSLQALLRAMNAHIHLHMTKCLTALVVAEHKVLPDLVVQLDLVLRQEA